jgi:rhodanese-related sulfurtransferase
MAEYFNRLLTEPVSSLLPMPMDSALPVEISGQEAQRLLAEKGANLRLIDVRDPEEYAVCRLPGAQLISLQVLPAEAPIKLPEKDADILLYCHHGMRSLRAAEYMRSVGYPNARSIAGGIDQWSREIDATIPRY